MIPVRTDRREGGKKKTDMIFERKRDILFYFMLHLFLNQGTHLINWGSVPVQMVLVVTSQTHKVPEINHSPFRGELVQGQGGMAKICMRNE